MHVKRLIAAMLSVSMMLASAPSISVAEEPAIELEDSTALSEEIWAENAASKGADISQEHDVTNDDGHVLEFPSELEESDDEADKEQDVVPATDGEAFGNSSEGMVAVGDAEAEETLLDTVGASEEGKAIISDDEESMFHEISRAEESDEPAPDESDQEETLYDQASSSVVHSGEWGTCTWRIYKDGLLEIVPTNGESGKLAESLDNYGNSFPWGAYAGDITKVVLVDGVELPSNCSHMFYYCNALKSIDVSKWDVSGVTNMYAMFDGCNALEHLDVSCWDTSSVEDMSFLFYECSSLGSLDVSRWDVSNVEKMSFLFYGCSRLVSLDVASWKPSYVRSMTGMFGGCSFLASLNLSGWDMQGVDYLDRMFLNCSSLERLDVSGWDLSWSRNLSELFSGCTALVSLNVKGWNFPDDGYDDGMLLDRAFFGCSSLTTLDLSDWNTSSVTSMQDLFRMCSSLKRVTLGEGFSFSGSSEGRLCSLPAGMWKNESTGKVLDEASLPNNVSATYVKTATTYPSGTWGTCSWNIDAEGTLTVRPGSGAPTSGKSPWGTWDEEITKIVFTAQSGKKIIAPADSSNLFRELKNARSFDLSGLDTSRVTDMSGMFSFCDSVVHLDLSGFDTSSVENMAAMFYTCPKLVSVNTSGWNTSKAESFYIMFANDESLTTVNVAKWDVSSSQNLGWMFYKCRSLRTIDVSRWKTKSVISAWQMFYGCTSLTKLDLSGWDVSSAESLDAMFTLCESLQSVDLSSWKISPEASTAFMFGGCFSLKTIYVGTGWVRPNIARSQSMFGSCGSLVGGKGTQWSSDSTDATYAIADVVGACGYLTLVDSKAPAPNFPDVKAGSWYEKVVSRAATLGLISGYDNGDFGPDDDITRGQVAVILWRMAGQPKAGSGALSAMASAKPFPDVRAGAYYYNAVSWASSAGVVSGYADGRFGPGDKVTREQLAVMLANYAKRVGDKPVSGSASDYSSMKDASKVASYARPAVGWCFRNKILSGSNGNVLPKGNATRAQAAKMLVGLYDLVN